MSYQLKPSLVDVGNDVLTETYCRISRVDNDEKERVGLDRDTEYKANIGIASIGEYITYFVSNVPRNFKAVFPLSDIGQDVNVESLYIDDHDADTVALEIYMPVEVNGVIEQVKIIDQKFSRNKTPFQFPINALPPEATIKVKVFSDVKYVRLVLRLCVVLERKVGHMEDNDGNIVNS